MNILAKGVFGTIIVNILLGLLLYGLLHFMTDAFSDASETLIRRSPGDDQLRIVLEWLGVARAALFGWVWKSLAISTLAAILFLIMASGRQATTGPQRQSLLGFWVLLLVVSPVTAWIVWYLQISAKMVGEGIAPGNYATILFATFAGVFFSYYLSTALFVNNVMLPSVPGAQLVRRR